MHTQISSFGIILLFFIGALVFITGGLLTARILRPNRPNQEKLSTYECGEESLGNSWGQFNIRFYIIALLFVLFDVEIVLLFPWATVFDADSINQATNGRWGIFSLAEASLFVLILALGLAYAWRKGFLEWIKPSPKPIAFKNSVPLSAYEQINQKYQHGITRSKVQ